MSDKPTETAGVRPGPEGDIWRVDVEGYACHVKGEHAKDHLEQVNRKLAKMKMALHRISRIHPSVGLGAEKIAREAISND